ncbi:pilin N-terminal domain-containing protein [uncultured Corynebacterium sp.]|uniref:pilin N-terminal domain-containing protein n=1 Tax=uncultured Corynebacterium sp. TaxID=159447 RepID=UPI0025E568F6|nr:pilin N-terminal domain-containing protein [uncultured Corynebacterium sp.]
MNTASQVQWAPVHRAGLRRSVFGLGAVVALVGTPLVAPTPVVPQANAKQHTITGQVEGLDVKFIGATRLGTLTVVKSEPNWWDDRGGKKPFGPIDNIRFTAQRVQGIDLTTEKGMNQAKRLSVADARRQGFDRAFEAYTDSSGKAVFTGLPVGLYLVTEYEGADPTKEYRQSSPFLITIPIGETGSWNYNVTVNTKPKPEDNPGTPPDNPGTPPDKPGTPPDKPGTPPDKPSTPGTPPPEHPDTPAPPKSPGGGHEGGESSSIIDRLAQTGAHLWWVALIGAMLVVVGAFTLLRRRRDLTESQEK